MKPIFPQRVPIRACQPMVIGSSYTTNVVSANGQSHPMQQPLRQSSVPSVPQQRQSVQFQAVGQQRYQLHRNQSTIPANQPMIGHGQSQRPAFLSVDHHSNKKTTTAQSIIYNESKTQEIHGAADSFKESERRDAKLRQLQDIIKNQNESLIKLQNEVQQKVGQLEEIQQNNTQLIKQFQEDFLSQLRSIDLNVEENDFTKLFLQELDRKAINLQNNVNDNIKLMKDMVLQQRSKVEQLCQNVACNITLRIEEDENHFKGELNIIRQQLNTRMDKQTIIKELQGCVKSFKAEIDNQVQHLKQQSVSLQSQTIQENQQIQQCFQQRIEQIEQLLVSQITELEQAVQSQHAEKLSHSKEKQQLQKYITQMQTKFQQIQQVVAQQKVSSESQIQQLQVDKQTLQKQVDMQNEEINLQRRQIQMLEQQISNMSSIQTTHEPPQGSLLYHMSPLQKKGAPFEKSFLSGGSISTRPETHKNRLTNEDKFEINLDDFVDFNENSLSDSIKSTDSIQCEFLYPKQQVNPFTKVYQIESPVHKKRLVSQPKHSFGVGGELKDTTNIQKQPKIVKSNNKLPDFVSFKKSFTKETSVKPKVIPDSKLTSIINSVKRRMRYINKMNEPLVCTYSTEGYLTDTYTQQYIVNQDGDIVIVEEKEKNTLIREGLIIVQEH